MKTGILSAFGMESRPLRTRMEEVDRSVVNGQVCYRLHCHDEEIMVVQSGMGTKRAAEGARLLIGQFGAQVVINCGTAGAICPQRRMGDVVVSDQVVACRAMSGHSTQRPAYRPHPALLSMALQVTSSGSDQGTVLAGTVLSGDHMVNSEEERLSLWGQYRGQCVEQEGAGVARICHESGIPWIVIRGISDLADGHVMRDFQENSRYAAANAADVAFRLVSLLVTVSDLDHPEMIQTQMS